MAMDLISVRIDKNLKENFKGFCDGVGLTPNGAVTLFMRQTVKAGQVPFEITPFGMVKGVYAGGEPQMLKTSYRVDKQLKNDYTAICTEMGINRSMLLKMFMKHCIENSKLPFTPVAGGENGGNS